MNSPVDLRQLLQLLEKRGELLRIRALVDPHLELAEIHRRVVAQGGPALLFEQVVGSRFRVVTNLFGTPERVLLAMGDALQKSLEQLLELLLHPPRENLWSCLWKRRRDLARLMRLGTRPQRQPALRCQLSSLDELPFLTCWPLDGGPFLTLPLVYTQCPDTGQPNLGIYRIQRFDASTAGLHFQIGKGAGFHLSRAEQLGSELPVTIFLGGSPALVAAAIAPLPESVNELLLASALIGDRLPTWQDPHWPHPLLANAEFAIMGRALSGKRRLEGPFGDHYGYYSLAHPFPYMQVEKVLARCDAIYPATVVGKPPQEDLYLGHWLQDLMRPLLRLTMPGVEELWSYGESGFHALAAARIQERYAREAITQGLRILGEGQLSLTKFLLLTDAPIPLQQIRLVLKSVLERMEPQRDLYLLSNLSLDTLDYTGPALNHGSRGVLIGTGSPKRQLPDQFLGPLPSDLFKAAEPFCPGCLLVEGPSYPLAPDAAQELAHPLLAPWPLVILVDRICECRSESGFLWTVFMRFDPARDLRSRHRFQHYHAVHSFPLVIDARTKPSYPPQVEVDPATQELVSRRWREYFH